MRAAMIFSFDDNRPGYCQDPSICNLVSLVWRLVSHFGWNLHPEWVASANNISDAVCSCRTLSFHSLAGWVQQVPLWRRMHQLIRLLVGGLPAPQRRKVRGMPRTQQQLERFTTCSAQHILRPLTEVVQADVVIQVRITFRMHGMSWW